MLTSCPPGSCAVTIMLTGITCAHRPWSGPELIWFQLVVKLVGHEVVWVVPGITEYWVHVTPSMAGPVVVGMPTAQIWDAEGDCTFWNTVLKSEYIFSMPPSAA